MRKVKTGIASFLLVSCALMTACSDNQVKQCADAAAKVSTTLGAFEETVEQVQTQGLISQDEAISVVTLIGEATKVNDEFVTQVRAAKKLNDPTLATLSTAFEGVTKSVDRLEQEGVLHIKNPDARTKLSIGLQSVRLALTAVKALADLAPKPDGSSTAPVTHTARETAFRRGLQPAFV
jgi:hypothetical protein